MSKSSSIWVKYYQANEILKDKTVFFMLNVFFVLKTIRRITEYKPGTQNVER